MLSSTLLLCAAGCSIGHPDPDKSFYTLAAPPTPSDAHSGGAPRTIRLARARVAPPYNARALQYRTAANRLEPSYYHNWADDPGALVTGAVMEAIASTGTFTLVDASSAAAATEILELLVTELAVDVTDRPAAVLSMRATLLDPDGQVLRTFELRHTEPATSAEATDVVSAWNTALARIVSELARELSAGAAAIG
jgi:uncharacterized lipoprotein YmbA